MDPDDEAMRQRVGTLAQRKRLMVAAGVVIAVGLTGWMVRPMLNDRREAPVEVSGEPNDNLAKPWIGLSASNTHPTVGEEVVFTLAAEGGPVVTDHAIHPGVPLDSPRGIPAKGFECGYESHASERTSTFRWTYSAPGEYVVRGSVLVLDPCTGESQTLQAETRVIVEP